MRPPHAKGFTLLHAKTVHVIYLGDDESENRLQSREFVVHEIQGVTAYRTVLAASGGGPAVQQAAKRRGGSTVSSKACPLYRGADVGLWHLDLPPGSIVVAAASEQMIGKTEAKTADWLRVRVTKVNGRNEEASGFRRAVVSSILRVAGGVLSNC